MWAIVFLLLFFWVKFRPVTSAVQTSEQIICNLCKLIGVCPAISFYIFRENYEFYHLTKF